jgi:tetratricopeptide (TPR) repeat protein
MTLERSVALAVRAAGRPLGSRRFPGQPNTSLLAVPLVLAGLAYARVLAGGFVLDDTVTALDPALRDLGEQARAVIPGIFRGGRPVVDLTLALNLAAGGADPWGFHLVNVVIHLVAVALVFAFTACTLELAGSARARGPALAVAGAFALHPIQSQAVAYVWQRGESLASVFYLSSLLLLLRSETTASARSRAALWAGAYGAFLIGLGTKQIVVTMPLAYALLMAAVPDGPTRAARPWRLRLILLAPFVATAAWYVHRLLASVEGHADVGTAVAVPGLTPWTYFLTQWRVLLVYLRLLVWPAGQCLDWVYPVTTRLDASSCLAGIALLALGGTSAALLWRHRGEAGEDAAAVRLSCFGALWFFLVLAPTSSFVPIADLLVEHRVYLASWGILTAGTVLAGRGLARLGDSRRAIVAASLVLGLWCLLAVVLHARNRVWESSVALWSDVVAKRPSNTRAHVALAAAYQERGELDRAVAEYELTLQIAARDDLHHEVEALLGLGAALVDLGRIDQGIAALERARSRDPENPRILGCLSEAWAHRGDWAQAETLALRAIASRPELGNALLVLGAARTARGDLAGAIEALERSVRADPDGAVPRLSLARAYAQLGHVREACDALRGVLRLPGALPEDRAAASREASASRCQGL